jgi:hypothetical protein
MTTEDSFGWEITVEPDQSCVKIRLKTRDGHLPDDRDIENAANRYAQITSKFTEKGFKVAPIK